MRFALRAAVILSLFCHDAPAHAWPATATSVFSLSVSFDDCRARVESTMRSAGFGGPRDFGNGVIAFTVDQSLSIGCIRGSGQTEVMIVVASNNSAGVATRDRLTALMRGDRSALPAPAASGCSFDYTGWDGSRWTARIESGGFVHAPNGTFGAAHRDSIIRYRSWDGGRWTAKISSGQFVHAPAEDWSRAHNDVILNYFDWSGAQRTPIGTCGAPGAAAACSFRYTGWDRTRWIARVEGSNFVHAPNGDFANAHVDTIIRYVSWDD